MTRVINILGTIIGWPFVIAGLILIGIGGFLSGQDMLIPGRWGATKR